MISQEGQAMLDSYERIEREIQAHDANPCRSPYCLSCSVALSLGLEQLRGSGPVGVPQPARQAAEPRGEQE
jgi:hypothetical protein